MMVEMYYFHYAFSNIQISLRLFKYSLYELAEFIGSQEGNHWYGLINPHNTFNNNYHKYVLNSYVLNLILDQGDPAASVWSLHLSREDN